jgi:hypothetical protein
MIGALEPSATTTPRSPGLHLSFLLLSIRSHLPALPARSPVHSVILSFTRHLSDSVHIVFALFHCGADIIAVFEPQLVLFATPIEPAI